MGARCGVRQSAECVDVTAVEPDGALKPIVRDVVRIGFELHRTGGRPTHIGRMIEQGTRCPRPWARLGELANGRRVPGGGAPVNRPGRGKLERHPIIALNNRVTAEPPQVGRTAGEQREQGERRRAPGNRHVFEQGRGAPQLPAAHKGVQTRFDRGPVRSDEEQIALANEPHRRFGEYRRERPHDRSQIAGADVVGMRPLADQAIRLQSGARRFEELTCEQRRDAGHPWIRRLGDDDVVAARRQQQMGSAIADDEADAGPVKGVSIFPLEERRCLHDFGRDFHDVGTPDGAGRQRRPDGHAASEPDDTDVLRIGMEKHGQEAEQALRQHVAHVRRIDFSVYHERAHTSQLSDAHRGDGAILVVKQLPRPELRLEIRRVDVGRVLVHAARQQIEIPRRQQEHDSGGEDEPGQHQCCASAHGWPPTARSQPHAQGGDEADQGSRAEGRVQADERQQHEPPDERTRDRAKCVRRVDAGRVAAGGSSLCRRHRQRERKCRAECARHRQQQDHDRERLARDNAAECAVGISHLRRDDQRQAEHGL